MQLYEFVICPVCNAHLLTDEMFKEHMLRFHTHLRWGKPYSRGPARSAHNTA
ncbi:hypothetical protein H4R19_002971 [Coemansia spiralis]|nr:hypothetical protein H4R19_002971 [Coemansia spiralis]